MEKWRTALDNNGTFGALLTDLSKAFDCLIHDLLIAKLHAYGIDNNSLRFIHDYLTNRKQRVKINSSYSSWRDIICGVPQGSILGPLLFNVYLCDLFLLVDNIDIASYADDTTPYNSSDNIQSVINSLETASEKLFNWFKSNSMKANAEKCHLLLSSNEKLFANIDNIPVESSSCEKLLGIQIDNKLTFENHLKTILKKTSQKLHALARISPYMNIAQKRTIMKAFITSQFGYCPLVWMFHSRAINNRINKLHERSLRIVYKDRSSTFEDLLEKDNSVTIHQRNLQMLLLEMYKVKYGLAPEIISYIFQSRNNLKNLRNNSGYTNPCNDPQRPPTGPNDSQRAPMTSNDPNYYYTGHVFLNRDLKGDSHVFKARFKLKLALARFILTTIELLCLFTKIKMSVSKLKLCL